MLSVTNKILSTLDYCQNLGIYILFDVSSLKTQWDIIYQRNLGKARFFTCILFLEKNSLRLNTLPSPKSVVVVCSVVQYKERRSVKLRQDKKYFSVTKLLPSSREDARLLFSLSVHIPVWLLIC